MLKYWALGLNYKCPCKQMHFFFLFMALFVISRISFVKVSEIFAAHRIRRDANLSRKTRACKGCFFIFL